MANVKILLIVDTEKISRNNVDESCSLVDNTSNMGSPILRDFKTYADSGSIIEWSGVAKNPALFDCVSIDSIAVEHRKGSVDLFGVPILIGSGGTIQATILAHKTGGRQEDYKLRFTVIRNKNGHNASYDIDPKLGVNN